MFTLSGCQFITAGCIANNAAAGNAAGECINIGRTDLKILAANIAKKVWNNNIVRTKLPSA